ncbi:MAG: hypothetical protein GX483_01930 [Actinomycetaceae bacterium]|nr:hypothetical protein [Actinomycetaceae bacterium]
MARFARVQHTLISALVGAAMLGSLSACGSGSAAPIQVAPEVAQILDGKTPEEYTVDDVLAAAPKAMDNLDSWTVTYLLEDRIPPESESLTTIGESVQEFQREPWAIHATYIDTQQQDPIESEVYLYVEDDTTYYTAHMDGEWLKVIPAKDLSRSPGLAASYPNPERSYSLHRINELTNPQIAIAEDTVILSGIVEAISGNFVVGNWHATYEFDATTLVVQSITWKLLPLSSGGGTRIESFTYSEFNNTTVAVPDEFKNVELTESFPYENLFIIY